MPAFQPYWENPPYGMTGGIEETSASFEARSAPRSYPTEGAMGDHRLYSTDGEVAAASASSSLGGAKRRPKEPCRTVPAVLRRCRNPAAPAHCRDCSGMGPRVALRLPEDDEGEVAAASASSSLGGAKRRPEEPCRTVPAVLRRCRNPDRAGALPRLSRHGFSGRASLARDRRTAACGGSRVTLAVTPPPCARAGSAPRRKSPADHAGGGSCRSTGHACG